MNFQQILSDAVAGKFLSFNDALILYERTPLIELMAAADSVRSKAVDDAKVVSWQIDCNVNITNVCSSGCAFCTFHCLMHQSDKAYITTIDDYCSKIDNMIALTGDQLLLQGGIHPRLGIEFYEELFKELKRRYPTVKLHALGAPEVFSIAKRANISIDQCLTRLLDAGMDSLPGAGAELLDNDWRAAVSPGKCSADEWLNVMRTAHQMKILTSATMMYGFRDNDALRIKHLLTLRDLQAQTMGFTAFIAWPYQGLEAKIESQTSEYLRLIATARLLLPNFKNVQASWLTVGVDAAQLALNGGANDLGSIIIEENVVRSAGVERKMDVDTMVKTIVGAGFTPCRRNQDYSNFKFKTSAFR